MHPHRSPFAGVLALVAIVAGPAWAAPMFTGNVPSDFAGQPDLIVLADPGGVDVGVPVQFPLGTISGNDMEDVQIWYDTGADTLYVGMNTYVIAGDVDGDGNPGAPGPILSGLGGTDLPDFGGTESFAFLIDVDQDGIIDAIVGVPFGQDTSSFRIAGAGPGALFTPSLAFLGPIPGVTGALYASPSALSPDLEFTVSNLRAIPPSSGVDTSGYINIATFIGSFSDAGIGEDFFPGVGTTTPVPLVYCGDGFTDAPEQCDDGNTNNNDSCTNTCELARCGDGFTGPGEQCDDGNANNNDACTNTCTTARCGDGFTGPGEQCDDGNANNNDGCTNTCTTARCGDGFTGPGEQCDDGNLNNNDACTNTCTTARCGDGFTGPGEQCDDGNANNNDGCTNTCTTARCGDGFTGPGEQCDDGNANNNDGCTNTCTTARCGDGFTGPGEQCDDGNANNNDACTNTCTTARCGDGFTGPGEQCDDGNLNNNDGCTNTCTTARCGDGFTGPGEQCDDGNANNNDSCTNACTTARCGDGITGPDEECDDGNTSNTDGCTTTCALPVCGDGFIQPGEVCDDGNASNFDGCTNDCLPAACGDGLVQQGEACDDGNTTPGDGCSEACEPEFCGDGIRQPDESCDDGNNVGGDGCSPTCLLEDCIDDLSGALPFNVFALTSYTGGHDVEGKAAAGTLLEMTGFSIARLDPGPLAAVAGGALRLVNGSLYGDGWWGAARTITGVNVVGGTVQQGTPVDFAATGADLAALSVRLCALSPNGTTTLAGGLTLSGADAAFNIFEVDAAELAAATSVNLSAPASSTVVVNLRGSDIELVNKGLFLSGVDRTRVLFNACDASAVEISGFAVHGSLLAPFADISFNNGDMNGQLIGWSIAGSGEAHHHPFVGELPCVACGDGVAQAGEACDDGNLIDGDGCSTTCAVEACGDGIRQPSEQCDDGNLVDGDGCGADCAEESFGACGDGVLNDGEQCDDGNTASGDGCSDACFRERCVIDAGPARFFNVYAATDYVGGRDVGGAVGAGGEVEMDGFRVGWQSPGWPSLYARVADLDYGQLFGNAFWADALISSDLAAISFPAGGAFIQATPFDFLDATTRAAQFSAVLGVMTPSGTVSTAWGGVAFVGGRPDTNVFEVPAATLAAAHTIGVSVPAGATAIINVVGGSPSITNAGIFLQGVPARRVIWNFPDATSLTLAGIGMQGTVLAPQADITFRNGSMLGSLIGYSVTGDGELYNAPYNEPLDCAKWEAMRTRRIAAGTWPWL